MTYVPALTSTGVSAGAGVTVASRVLENFSLYAPLIGVVVSITSLVLGIVFFVIADKRSRIHDELMLKAMIQQGKKNEHEDKAW